jgi:hypothetical protein
MKYLAFRFSAIACSVAAAWRSYRLFTNPFVACEPGGFRIPGRWIADICEKNGSDAAGCFMAVWAAILLVLAILPFGRKRA